MPRNVALAKAQAQVQVQVHEDVLLTEPRQPFVHRFASPTGQYLWLARAGAKPRTAAVAHFGCLFPQLPGYVRASAHPACRAFV
jgi:hypothetical protein